MTFIGIENFSHIAPAHDALYTTLVIVTRSRTTMGLYQYQNQKTWPLVSFFSFRKFRFSFPPENSEGNSFR